MMIRLRCCVVEALTAVIVCFSSCSVAGLNPDCVETSASAESSEVCALPMGIQVCGGVASSNLNSILSHRYLVVDLSDGIFSERFPVRWLNHDPNDGWADEYKTTKIVLRRITPGSFVMGAEKTNMYHLVTLTKPFFIGVFEVTQRQWELVMGTRPSHFKDNYEKRPVESVSFDMIRGRDLGAKWPKGEDVDAYSFLGILRKRTGLKFDLPTEAQWEYACSAGADTEYSYGSDPDGRYMWFGDNSEGQTHEVGLKLPNKWNLFDMHGNVSEWCLNRNSPMFYGDDPRGLSVGSYRMKRGGDWFFDGEDCSTFRRGRGEPSDDSSLTGFRLIVEMCADSLKRPECH